MLSQELKKKYDDTYKAFEEMVEETKVSIRHRSIKKYEDGTNQDILFFIADKRICGVYVAKDKYKIWLDNAEWYKLSGRNPTMMKDDGYYSIFT